MRCSAMDTGPDRGQCENEATTRNELGHLMCQRCADISAEVIAILDLLSPMFGLGKEQEDWKRSNSAHLN